MAWVKAIHIACVVVWLGNFVVTGLWSARAFAGSDAALRRFAAREILVTDALFTLLFGAGVVISGFALAALERVDVLAVAWTRDALAILAAATLAWLGILLPLEVTLLRRTAAGRPAAAPFAAWSAVGWAVTLGLFAVIYLMVAKPV
jgi:uncharacterized membrane protein